MKITKVTLAAVLALSVAFTSCKQKDSDIQTTVQSTQTTGITATVNDGVATLTGEVADDAAKMKAEESAKASKGVKSVVNNITVMMPAAPVVVTADDPLMMSVNSAVKDHPTVQATVVDGVITLNGTLAKSKLANLMMTLNSLKPRKIDNNLTIN